MVIYLQEYVVESHNYAETVPYVYVNLIQEPCRVAFIYKPQFDFFSTHECKYFFTAIIIFAIIIGSIKVKHSVPLQLRLQCFR